MTLLWLLVLLLGIAVLAHLRVAPRLALAVVATYLVFMTAADTSEVVVFLLWLALIAIALPLLVADVRRKYFSGPMFDGVRACNLRYLQDAIESMPECETITISAGEQLDPIVVRPIDEIETYSILMPVRV